MTPRFRPSTRPPAPARSSGSRSSWGEGLPSWEGSDALLAGNCITSITVVVLVLTSMFPVSLHLRLWFSCSFISFFLSLFPPAARRPLPRGPGDVIGDCKVQFLDEIYQVEKPGSRALSAADGQFKRT